MLNIQTIYATSLISNNILYSIENKKEGKNVVCCICTGAAATMAIVVFAKVCTLRV